MWFTLVSSTAVQSRVKPRTPGPNKDSILCRHPWWYERLLPQEKHNFLLKTDAKSCISAVPYITPSFPPLRLTLYSDINISCTRWLTTNASATLKGPRRRRERSAAITWPEIAGGMTVTYYYCFRLLDAHVSSGKSVQCGRVHCVIVGGMWCGNRKVRIDSIKRNVCNNDSHSP